MQNNLIIFDIDGTLTNTNHADSVFFEKAILDSLPISSIDSNFNYRYSTDLGVLTEIIQIKLKREPALDEIESIKNKFVSYLQDSFMENKSFCLPIEGSQFIFKNLFANGWDIGIATGGWQKSALLKLRTAQIPYQDIPIAHSDDHFEREKIILTAIARAEKFYKKPFYEKIIYVGDRNWDKKAANNLNIEFIGIGNELGAIANRDFLHISDFKDPQFMKYLTQ